MIILIAANLALVSVLAACGSSTGDEQPSAAPQAEEQGQQENDTPAEEQQAPEETAEVGLPEKYDPPIELTTVNFSLSTTKFFNNEDINNNVWTRTLSDTFGINVETKWYVPIGDYATRLNLTIATGDIPDFFVATPDQFKQLYEADLLEDMTKIYEDYAPKSVKDVIKAAGETVLKSAKIDGKLMGIPWTGVGKESPSLLWVRKDWKEKLGLPDPKTAADLFAISEAFAKQDPDGNGEDDTFGLGLDNAMVLSYPFLNSYGAYIDMWLKDSNGQLVYSEIQPEMKQALGKLNEMHAAGHFDPEFIVKHGGNVFEDVGRNKIGLFLGSMGNPTAVLATQTPDTDWLSYTIPTADGSPFLAPLNLNIYNNFYWVVKKGTKNPEAIFKMMEFWLDTYYYNKDEAIYYQYVVPSPEDSSALWTYSPTKLYLADNNVENYRQANAVLEGRMKVEDLAPPRKRTYDLLVQFQNGQQDLRHYYAQYGPNGSASLVDKFIQADQYKYNQFYSTPTPTMIERNAQLAKLRNETFIRIVLGELPLDAFDQFVADWRAQGGDAITKEVNEWYSSQN